MRCVVFLNLLGCCARSIDVTVSPLEYVKIWGMCTTSKCAKRKYALDFRQRPPRDADVINRRHVIKPHGRAGRQVDGLQAPTVKGSSSTRG